MTEPMIPPAGDPPVCIIFVPWEWCRFTAPSATTDARRIGHITRVIR